MKFTHDGTEYEVAELVRAVTYASKKLAYSQEQVGATLRAAAALIARHERVCEALERFVAVEGEPREFKSKRNRLGTRSMIVCPYCELITTQDFHETSCPLGLARAALRGEEAPGG